MGAGRAADERELPPLSPPARLARDLRMAPRRLTSGLRALPDFLILGAQRAGTTSLHAYLERHPGVLSACVKEVHYFDLHHARGLGWYRAHFPTRLATRLTERARRTPVVVGEATPYYLFHPCVPARARAALPDARLVVVLRDPVERAFSHYRHERRWGFEDAPTFAEALAREEARLRGEEERLLAEPDGFSFAHNHHAYVARGIYAPQLRRWLEHYPREQLLVLTSEALFARPEETARELQRFLGLEQRPLGPFPRFNETGASALDPGLRAELEARFRPHEAELYELLGRAPGWSR